MQRVVQRGAHFHKRLADTGKHHLARIAAGRADLCAVARPHLADPAWTLHEAARLQTRAIDWPLPYLSGRDQLYREIARQQTLQGAVVTQDPAETS